LAELELQNMFGTLSEDQQQTLRPHFIEGYTLDEIAKMLGQTKGNVRHHSFRGLERLRKQIFGGKLPGTRAGSMIRGLSNLGAGELSQSEPHDEFLELCAASTTGELSDDEQKRLRQHLAVCVSCREALRQYESIVSNVIPSIAASEAPENVSKSVGDWSQENAEQALFDRLAREEKDPDNRPDRRNGSSYFPHRILPFSSESTWRNVWMLYAAGILLFVAVGFFAYRVGVRRATETVKAPSPQPVQHEPGSAQAPLEEQLSDAGHDREIASAEAVRRDKMITDLRRQLARQSGEISELKAQQIQLESSLRAGDVTKQDLSEQKNALAQKLESAENNSHSLEQKLDSLAQQSAQDAARAKASEAKANDLTEQLQQQQAAVEQRDELLAHDRDIRDVIGARDLYIAEIYDVAGTGETKKPYGRIFYTRGKSLIFYAYDLDQQVEVKRASTFQAWGRRGPDLHQAINLGVFYEDNATRKRWILKCDDPRTLAQIDAVFVTVEPQGGSHKPSSKTLLFASLKIDPNHP
jgi:Sigma-70, region 4/Anti-sigma-K factor rskA, C-terminal/Putative zinc-finger